MFAAVLLCACPCRGETLTLLFWPERMFTWPGRPMAWCLLRGSVTQVRRWRLGENSGWLCANPLWLSGAAVEKAGLQGEPRTGSCGAPFPLVVFLTLLCEGGGADRGLGH